jgi:hypothetical protein
MSSPLSNRGGTYVIRFRITKKKDVDFALSEISPVILGMYVRVFLYLQSFELIVEMYRWIYWLVNRNIVFDNHVIVD